MRYTRLRRQIESGTLIGTHGTPFPSDKVVEKNAEAKRKRKQWSPGNILRNDAKEDALGENENKTRAKRKSVIKKEGDRSDRFETSEDSESEFADTEDEMPLAKVMKFRSKTSDGLPKQRTEHGNIIDGAESRSWAWESK